MNPLASVALVAAMVVPFAWLVHRHFRLLADPRYLREHGVVIVADHVLEARSAPIGRYKGCPVWGAVTFMGMQYRFDHVIEPRHRERIKARELYLEPGLVYVTD
jgi:hypothetical protein